MKLFEQKIDYLKIYTLTYKTFAYQYHKNTNRVLIDKSFYE